MSGILPSGFAVGFTHFIARSADFPLSIFEDSDIVEIPKSTGSCSMKGWVMAAVLAAMASSAQAADAVGATPGVAVKGEGRWQMQCRMVVDGLNQTVILSAQRASFANSKLTQSECTYRGASDSALEIAVVGAEACPFGEAAGGACTLTTSKGSGSFKFRVPRAH
ncbi:hypothetical protein P7B02_15600 [Caulobacter segnis]|uniref:hypothetical protein n=1 Tax=Caulobacter segnis TaxID=88688 RepID=UPI00240F4324|nr:hypothetical protein [Caulobacter segnis]MDG2522960.1 hypothetical protein [Caulobacter segnis]